jgi:hypothetical protein
MQQRTSIRTLITRLLFLVSGKYEQTTERKLEGARSEFEKDKGDAMSCAPSEVKYRNEEHHDNVEGAGNIDHQQVVILLI